MDAAIRHIIFTKLIIGNFCVVWDVIVDGAELLHYMIVHPDKHVPIPIGM